jgi:hypothetical protein
MSRLPARDLARNFTTREFAFISGNEDNATEKPNPPIPHDPKNGADLDVSCAAKFQGASRLERSYLFHKYLAAEFPGTKQAWFGIPGVAHSYAVYEDARVVELLSGPK